MMRLFEDIDFSGGMGDSPLDYRVFDWRLTEERLEDQVREILTLSPYFTPGPGDGIDFYLDLDRFVDRKSMKPEGSEDVDPQQFVHINIQDLIDQRVDVLTLVRTLGFEHGGFYKEYNEYGLRGIKEGGTTHLMICYVGGKAQIFDLARMEGYYMVRDGHHHIGNKVLAAPYRLIGFDAKPKPVPKITVQTDTEPVDRIPGTKYESPRLIYRRPDRNDRQRPKDGE